MNTFIHALRIHPIAGLLLLLNMPFAIADSITAKTLNAPMQAQQNYFRENCVVSTATQYLSFSYTSPYKVNFNIHHHTDTITEYPANVTKLEQYSGKIIVVPGEYCFMWQNPQKQAKAYVISLQYEFVSE